ncbi:MAG: hypothetical protein WC867_05630 [Candidatus Pacearchaeota archaeon]
MAKISRLELYSTIESKKSYNKIIYGDPVIDEDLYERMNRLKEMKVHSVLEEDRLSREIVKCILNKGNPGVKIEGLGKKSYSFISARFPVEDSYIDSKLRNIRDLGLIDIIFEINQNIGDWLFESEMFISKKPDKTGKIIHIKTNKDLRNKLNEILKPFEDEKPIYSFVTI